MDRRSFVTASIAAATAAATAKTGVLHALAGPIARRGLLQVKGREIVEGGRPLRLRGVNLGGWMLIEDYMIGLPWTEWKIREQFKRILGAEAFAAFFDTFDRAFLAEPDISFIAQQGFNIVRLAFNYRHFENDMAPGKWIEAGFQQLDRAVSLCRKYGIWVMLDLHAAPGAQARDQNAGSAYGETYFWNYRSFIDRTIAFWGEIARRYKGDPIIAGYNLLGEPVSPDVRLLNEFYLAAIRAVRKIDPDHIIFLDPNRWATDIPSLQEELFADPQIVVAIHPYFQGDTELTSLSTYPAVVEGKSVDRAALLKMLDDKYQTGHLKCPVMAAEFGVFRSNSQPFATQLAIARDQVSIFEEKGWSWSMWCYKDLRDMGLVTVRRDTPWRRFLDSPEVAGLKTSYQPLEDPFTQKVGKLLGDTDIDSDTREQWAREVARDFDVPALDFILRRLSKYTPPQLAEMARSFEFASCETHPDQLAILKPYLGSP